MYYQNDYDDLNKKLYESGNAVDKITNDPVAIARQYAEAGVDVSRYSPSTLQRAHEEYIDYEYNAKWADNDDEPKLSAADEAILEEERRKAQLDYEAQLEDEREINEWMAEQARIFRERERIAKELGYVNLVNPDDVPWKYTYYLKQLCQYPKQMYDYLKSKGAYEETTTIEFKTINYEKRCIEVCGTKTVNTYEELFLKQNLVQYNKETKKYSYGYIIDINDRCEYDLQYFDSVEWDDFIAPETHLESLLSEMAILKSMTEKQMRTPEEVAIRSFSLINRDILKAKETYGPEKIKRYFLDYKLSRYFAFVLDPVVVTDTFERVMKQIIH